MAVDRRCHQKLGTLTCGSACGRGDLPCAAGGTRALRVQGHLLLGVLDAAETVFERRQDVELLEESCHELLVFLLRRRQRFSRGLALGVVSHGVGSLVV